MFGTPHAPHEFSHIRTGDRRSMLVIGAGLSAGLVPLPGALIESWKESAEEKLGLSCIDVDLSDSDALYQWAEEAIGLLTARGEDIPKLHLAEAIGVLTEREWTANVGLPLRGTMPRHRVLARLARERKWASVWSLNWDTHLENALERIGLNRDRPIDEQPWITAYRTIIIPDDFRYLSQTDQFFCILKPHGCVHSLIQAREFALNGDRARAAELSDRFMITKSELEIERNNRTDEKFFEEFRAQLNKSPLVVLGWRISEPYLKGVINNTIKTLIDEKRPEELTVIDVEFNDGGHLEIATVYSLKPNDVFMQLGRQKGGFNSDEFFLWLQARFALDQIHAHVSNEVSDNLAELTSDMGNPMASHFLFDWADVFLPAWVRLCWRGELVPCAGFEPHQLRIELEDEHIPWDLSPLPRADLASAGLLLAEIVNSQPHWNYEKFPGGIFDPDSGRLVLPLPAWGELSDLAAIGPLLNVLERDIAFVESIDILLVPSQRGQPKPTQTFIDIMKDVVSRHMRVPRFADPEKLGNATEFQLWDGE